MPSTLALAPEHLGNRVVILPMIRMGSGRLPGKMLKTLGDKPLAEWAMCAIRNASEMENVDICVGVGHSDIQLVQLVRKLGIHPLFRDDESIMGETVDTVYNKSVRSQLEPWDWVVVTCCCSPFVPVEVYRNAIRLAKDATHQGLSAIQHRGWVWNADFDLIVGDQTLNTKTSPVYFTPAHIYDILKVELVGTPRMLEGCLPVVVEDSLPNRIHVDTEEDWRLAELYLQSQQLREGG